MFRSALSRHLVVGGVLVLASLALPPAVHAQSIFACVKEANQVRIVDASQSCQKNETRIFWNVVGPQGPAGAGGSAGPAGAPGPAGPSGAQGPAGPAGATGATGSQGPAGPAGPGGLAGSTGAAGPAGAQGFSAAITPDDGTGCGVVGGLRLTLVDGNGVDVPNTIPAFVCNGASGGKGDTGGLGPAGAPGQQGPQGPQGVQGVAGAKGDTGATGAAGGTGPAGPTGSQGVPGAQGPQGFQGVQGAQGIQGAPGSVLLGAQNWAPGAIGPLNLPGQATFTTVTGSGFAAQTQGRALIISVIVPLLSNGGGVSCQPAIDGVWAGAKAFPQMDPFNSTKEGFWGGSGYVLWSTSRVYSNVPAGFHQFSIQCWSAGPVSYVSTTALASMTVIEM